MNEEYPFINSQNRKILIAGLTVFAIATVVAAIFGDWLLAGISAGSGLVVWGLCWLSQREILAKVLVSTVWLGFGILLAVFHPGLESTRRFLFFIGFETCLVLSVLWMWFGPRTQTQWTVAGGQLLGLATLVCYWGQRG